MNNRLILLAFSGAILGCGAARADTLCYAGASGQNIDNPTAQSTTCTGAAPTLSYNGGYVNTGGPSDVYVPGSTVTGAGVVANPNGASNNGNYISLTNGAAGGYGSVATANSFAVGSSFTTTFDFQISQAGGTLSSYGFAFVIGQSGAFGQQSGSATNPGYALGIGSADSVDVLFGTQSKYQTGQGGANNGVVYTGPAYLQNTSGKTIYSDNYVGVVQNGATLGGTPGALTSPGIPTSGANLNYGIVSATSSTPGYYSNGVFQGGSKNSIYTGNNTSPGICDQTGYSQRLGCLADGDTWSAKITIANGVVTVSLVDLGGEGENPAARLSNPADNLAVSTFSYNLTPAELAILAEGGLDIGFTSAGGAQNYEQVNILNWDAGSVVPAPEPAAAAVFAAGLLGLGVARRKRAA